MLLVRPPANPKCGPKVRTRNHEIWWFRAQGSGREKKENAFVRVCVPRLITGLLRPFLVTQAH